MPTSGLLCSLNTHASEAPDHFWLARMAARARLAWKASSARRARSIPEGAPTAFIAARAAFARPGPLMLPAATIRQKYMRNVIDHYDACCMTGNSCDAAAPSPRDTLGGGKQQSSSGMGQAMQPGWGAVTQSKPAQHECAGLHTAHCRSA